MLLKLADTVLILINTGPSNVDLYILEEEVRYSSDCQIPWIGDGYCQPINNWSACNFDGGDCGKNCRGVTSHGGILGLYDRNCCTREEPCAINQGDCDRSYQCQGNLVCGKDNCGKGFPRSADCCEPGTGEKYFRIVNFWTPK